MLYMFNYDCTIVPLIIFGILHLTEKDAVLTNQAGHLSFTHVAFLISN